MIATSVDRCSAGRSSAKVPQRRQSSRSAKRDETQASPTLRHDSVIAATGLALLLLSCQLIAGCHSRPVAIPHIGIKVLDAGAIADRLRALTSNATPPETPSANFIDDRQNAQKVYEAIQYSPAWVREGQATPQAISAISALENSQQKGLNPEDYDASHWSELLAALKAAP